MNPYTKVPNFLFEESDLSIKSRYLFCILLKYCGKKDTCFPSQKTLARVIGCSDRNVRKLLNELIVAGIVYSQRTGFNKPNTYKVSKDLVRNQYSYPDMVRNEKPISPHLGTPVPLHMGSQLPTNSNYIKEKDKNFKSSLKALESCRERLLGKGFNVSSKTKQFGFSKQGGDVY